MQIEISHETLSNLAKGLSYLIRGLKALRKLVANLEETANSEAGEIGNSSPVSPPTTAVVVTGEEFPNVSSVVPTVVDADLTTEALNWLHRSKFAYSGVPGVLPFGQELMMCLFRNRIRGDRNHNVWVLQQNHDPLNRRCWNKAGHAVLSRLQMKLEGAMLACFEFVVDTKERPSRFNQSKWKRRMNILKWRDSCPSVSDLEKFARTQHDMLPAFRTL